MATDENELTDIETIISEFESEIRLEKAPTVVQFQKKYPEFARELERFLPTVEALEQAKLAKKRTHSSQWKTPTIENLGDFRIVREVGRGGMGIVFEAEQVALARRVAIKVLPKHLLLSENALKRFHREAKTAAQLHHTNIVSILDVGEEDGLHYYVMQYIDGVGLNDLMASFGDGNDREDSNPRRKETISSVRSAMLADHFSSEAFHTETSLKTETASERVGIEYYKSVARIALQVADALDYAHRHKVLHRDIKPANLMIQSDGKVWVMDFGVAKAFEDMAVSLTGDVVGTPRYMSPEQYKGKATAQSDIYSLGVTVFELLTRRAADESVRENAAPTSVPHLRPLNKIRRYEPSIPKDLETIVMRATALEPRQRYKNAASLAVDLQRFIFDQPIVARRQSAFEKTIRWCKQNPALSTISTLAITLLLLVLMLSISSYFRERAQRQKIEEALAVSIDSLGRVYEQNTPSTIRDLAVPLDRESDPVAHRQNSISKESAKMLEDLLPYYDQLAELGNDSPGLKFQAAQATRRVGEIHSQLGNWEDSENALRSAINRFASAELADLDPKSIRKELSQSWMALGDLHFRQYKIEEGDGCFHQALAILSRNESEADKRIVADSEIQFMIASANFFLGTVPKSAPNSMLRGDSLQSRRDQLQQARDERMKYLETASRIIDQLSNLYPNSARCTHLRALCHRELSTELDDEDMKLSIELLHKLVDRFPEVNEFRINLCETYARVDPQVLSLDESLLGIKRLDSALEYGQGVNQNTVRYKLMAAHSNHKLSTLHMRLLRANQTPPQLGSRVLMIDKTIDHAEKAVRIYEDIVNESDQLWARVWICRFREARIQGLRLRDQTGDQRKAIDDLRQSIMEYDQLIQEHPDDQSLVRERDRWIQIRDEIQND